MNNSLHTLQSKFTFRKVTTFSIDLKIVYVEILVKIRDLYQYILWKKCGDSGLVMELSLL